MRIIRNIAGGLAPWRGPSPDTAPERRDPGWLASAAVPSPCLGCVRSGAHAVLDDLAEAQLAGTRKEYVTHVTTVPLLIIDDLGMRKLPQTAAEDLLELVTRRYEKASTLITSNRPVEDWGKLLGDTAAVAALLDRLLHHAHVLTCGPRSWRTRLHSERNAS